MSVFDAAMAFVHENAERHSPYKESLKAAGGLRKVDLGDGTTAKANPLTGDVALFSCGLCGALAAKMPTCAGCGSVRYCSRECQESNWSQHKIRCREIKKAEYTVTPSINQDTVSDLSRWILSQPNMATNLSKASIKLKLDGELPVVMIFRGNNDRRMALSYGGYGTKESVDKLKREYPALHHMFREFDAGPLHPIIAIVWDGERNKAGAGSSPSVVRLRVRPSRG